MNTDARFYENLLADAATRDRLNKENCQDLLDCMENEIPHDQLPPVYDWLVARRDELE